MYLLQKIYKVYSPVHQSSGFQVVPTHLKQKKLNYWKRLPKTRKYAFLYTGCANSSRTTIE